jgi:hypothetical protein
MQHEQRRKQAVKVLGHVEQRRFSQLITMSFPSLAAALAEFYHLLHSPARQPVGVFEKREQSSSVPKLAGIALSAELVFLYQQYTCDISVTYANITLVPVDGLARRQEGFASFSVDAGNTLQPNPTWVKGWTVFADINDDPIVADTTVPGTPIYAAIEGVEYQAIAPSLATFIQLLSEMLKTEDRYQHARPDSSQDIEKWVLFKETTLIPHFLRQAATLLDSQHLAALDNFLHT